MPRRREDAFEGYSALIGIAFRSVHQSAVESKQAPRLSSREDHGNLTLRKGIV